MPEQTPTPTPLAEGEKIAKPGLYRVEIDRYHNPELCEGPSVSSGGLRTIDLRGAAYYWAFSPYNPNRFEKKETAALRFGRAAHCLLLGDEVFEEGYAVEPDLDALGDTVFRSKDEIVDWLRVRGLPTQGTIPTLMNRVEETGSGKPYVKDVIATFRQEAEGKTIISAQDYAHISGMAEALQAHPLVQADILQGTVEPTIVWQEAGIWVKARPDVLPISGAGTDLKTIIDCTPEACVREIRKRGYDMQLSLADMGLRALGMPGIELASNLFVQKTPPYTVHHVEIDPERMIWASRRNRRAIQTFAEGIATGEWKGLEDPICGLSKFEREQLELQVQRGLLPSE